MRSRRHTSKFILTVASVFLFLAVSCGIPTYIVPKVSFSSVNPGDNSDSFAVTYNCSDPLGDSGRVGLLLLYAIDYDNPYSTPTKDPSLISKFKSTFVPTEYNGANIDINEGEAIIESEKLNAFSFLSIDSSISDPYYTAPLPNSDDFSREVKITYSGTGNYILTVGGIQVATLILDPSTEISNGYCLGLYAAVSVKSNSYTNHYWSDLKFVGYIRVVSEE